MYTMYTIHVSCTNCILYVYVSLPWGSPVGGAQLLRQGFDFVRQRRYKAENAKRYSGSGTFVFEQKIS